MMFSSINEEQFKEGKNEDEKKKKKKEKRAKMEEATRKQMLQLMNRVMDRTKPLFVFNSKEPDEYDDEESDEASTPSFSMVALFK